MRRLGIVRRQRATAGIDVAEQRCRLRIAAQGGATLPIRMNMFGPVSIPELCKIAQNQNGSITKP